MSNDNPDFEPSVDLPRPQMPSVEMSAATANSFAAESASVSAELPQQGGPQQGATVPAGALPTAHDPVLPQGPAAPSSGSAAASPAGELSAEDADLIEKEWVLRAKALVEKTKDDPHQQNKDMNKFKAEYVKKRFNKELKVTEG